MNKSSLEIERKFIIRIPDTDKLSELPDYTRSRIIQTYLESSDSVTLRVRFREYEGRVEYTETEKRRVDYMSAEEREREITSDEYGRLLQNIKQGTSPIEKTRYTFSYCGQLYEVDIYPRWKHSCIMEAELKSPDCELIVPPFIELVREVTGDKTYSNASMSRHFPPEDEE